MVRKLSSSRFSEWYGIQRLEATIGDLDVFHKNGMPIREWDVKIAANVALLSCHNAAEITAAKFADPKPKADYGGLCRDMDLGQFGMSNVHVSGMARRAA
jgi:hypothetical protein